MYRHQGQSKNPVNLGQKVLQRKRQSLVGPTRMSINVPDLTSI
jgi:hypothetical protein